jgi:hypothetical protein
MHTVPIETAVETNIEMLFESMGDLPLSDVHHSSLDHEPLENNAKYMKLLIKS